MKASVPETVSQVCSLFGDTHSLMTGMLAGHSFAVVTIFSVSAVIAGIIVVILIGWAFWRLTLRRLLIMQRQKHWQEAAHYLHQRELFSILSLQLHKPFSKMVESLTDVLTGDFLSDKVSAQLLVIRDSGLRLMTTVHDLLEASTLLKEGNKLRVEESNLVDIVESVCATFGEWAEQKKLSIEKQLFGCVSRTYLDPIKVELILENMLSNACRTVPRGGQLLIRITVEQQEAKIEIYTTTMGSRLESLTRRLKRVATPWESERDEMRDQLDLCIVKLAAMAHNGFALCSYGPDNKRRLAVHLPLESREHQDRQGEMTSDWAAPERDDTLKYQYHDDKPKQGTIAWITNQPEPGIHKGQQLRGLEMTVNSNLEFGIAEITRARPDIILVFVDSVALEVMDWLTTLKQEPELAQIPVMVLCDSLAAETVHELHLAGADACVQGSIQPRQLEQRINSIVAQREHLKNTYSKRFVIKTVHSSAGDLNADEHFLNSIVRIIERRLNDSSLGVGTLMQEMGMSHSVLYRRVNAITGKGITDFIRFVRLNKAMDMLKEGKKSVADISTSTGFSSAKYFSTCFKAEFGVRPTDVTNGMSRRAG